MQQELEVEFRGLSRSWKRGQAGRDIDGEQAFPLRTFRDLERLEIGESQPFVTLPKVREQPRYEIRTVYGKEPIETNDRLDEKNLRTDLAYDDMLHI